MVAKVEVVFCILSSDVRCPFRKHSASFDVVMPECIARNCPEYVRFMADMEKADEDMMDKIDRIRSTGVWED